MSVTQFCKSESFESSSLALDIPPAARTNTTAWSMTVSLLVECMAVCCFDFFLPLRSQYIVDKGRRYFDALCLYFATMSDADLTPFE